MNTAFLQEMQKSDLQLLDMLRNLKKHAGQTLTVGNKDDLIAVIEEAPFGISFTEEQWSELQKLAGILADNTRKKLILLQKILQVS